MFRGLLSSVRSALGVAGNYARVGEDRYGNIFYEAVGVKKANWHNGRKMESPSEQETHVLSGQVHYDEEYSPDKVHVLWSAWLRGSLETPPTPELLEAHDRRQAMIIQRAADISAKDEAERQAKLIDDSGYKQLGYQTDHAGARSYTGTQASSNPQTVGGEFKPGQWDPSAGGGSSSGGATRTTSAPREGQTWSPTERQAAVSAAYGTPLPQSPKKKDYEPEGWTP